MASTMVENIREEHVNIMEKKKRKTLEKYVSLDSEGNIEQINWEKLIKFKHNFQGDYVPLYSDLLYYLYIKGILASENTNDSFFIIGCGMDLSPNESGNKYHFTRKKDAEEFAKYEYETAKYKYC
jgi:hypothetical protein